MACPPRGLIAALGLMANHGKECQLCILILQSAEAHNKLLSTQGVPLRLINIKQVVNPFAILGPEYCFVFALTSQITSNTCNAIKGTMKPLVIAAYNIVQRVWKLDQVWSWQLFLTAAMRDPTVHLNVLNIEC